MYIDDATGAQARINELEAVNSELKAKLSEEIKRRKAVQKEAEENDDSRTDGLSVVSSRKDRRNNGGNSGDSRNSPRADRIGVTPGGQDSEVLDVEITAYTARCVGCSGITSEGVDVRNTIHHEGRRVIATDPAVIASGSLVTISLENGQRVEAIAADVSGAIKGKRVDLLVGTKEEALSFGRQSATVDIIRKGDR